VRLGVFGGTFDPIHVGHLVAAVNAAHAARLDEVLMVVANQPWQKVDTRELSPAVDRLALVRAAVEGYPKLVVSDIELRRGGNSYTADTLAELKRTRPEAELFVVVGADVAAQLHTWERQQEVAEAATLVVVNRPTVAVPALGPPWRVIEAHMPAMDLSSTELRQRASDGRPLDFLIPEPAIRFIASRALYSESR
jgi:nicotinate-nucleotide adenylyltransferase